MTSTTPDLFDTADWLPLDQLAPGFDANKAEPSHALEGADVTVDDDHGSITYRFGGGSVQREGVAMQDPYEAFDVADGLVYAQFQPGETPEATVSLVLDTRAGRSLTIVTTIRPPQPGRTRVGQEFRPGLIRGTEPTGDAPTPTTALIGRRVLWIYSEQHAYEHVYLSPDWYSWQCLAGPERGLADTDENSVWQIRPGIYVFAWREKVIPCASMTVADHRDLRALRSHGVLFGLDESGSRPTHFTFGAYGRLLSATVHPEGLDPAMR